MTPKLEADVETEQPDPSQVDSLVQQLAQVSVNNDVAPALTEVDNLAQEISQVSLRDAVPHTAATPQRAAIIMPSATSSGSTSKPTRSLLINHNNAIGVTLYTVGRPEKYLETVKKNSPFAEGIEFSVGEVNDLLQTIEMHARSSLTKQGNPSWRDDDAKLAWDAAKEFQKHSETKSPASVQIPAETPPSTPGSPSDEPTGAMLINHNIANGVTLYTVARPESYLETVKKKNALAEGVEFSAEDVDRFLQTIENSTRSSLTSGGNPNWKDKDAKLAWGAAKEFSEKSETKLHTRVKQIPAESPPSIPSSSTNKPVCVLLINHNDPMKGVTLYTVRRPERYLKVVKEKNPLAEAVQFSIEEFDSFLQTIEMTRSSLTSGGNLTWKYENAKLAWGSAKDFSEKSEVKSGLLMQTETNSPANVQTPAKVPLSTASSSTSEPTQALLINSPMQGVAEGQNICNPESDTVKTGNPLVDGLDIPTGQVKPPVQAIETSASEGNPLHTWLGDDAGSILELVKAFLARLVETKGVSSEYLQTPAANPPPPYSVAKVGCYGC
ncbi:hypothetical protein BJ741DRAFT_123521 [Chytriomyces cf. hyalinus JEL632]|nr:hypothetical protein BJ741DRAFT_123521 [Chytriomyces cf. hyalinus JEL632]